MLKIILPQQPRLFDFVPELVFLRLRNGKKGVTIALGIQSERTHRDVGLVILASEGNVEAIRVRSAGDTLKMEITVRDHALTADEPKDAGGGDGGPTPYELLLASLGS